MKKRLHDLLVLTMVVATISTSCKKDDDNSAIPDNGYLGGIYIVNEGGFPSGTGTIDFLTRNMTKYENLYENSNDGQVLGSLVNSVQVIGSETYIVVNNSNKIEVVDTKTFKKKATIDNLPLPRYIIQADEIKAFVSCWGDSTIKIVNLSTYEIMKSFRLNGPEKMLKVENKVWALSQGGLSVDSVILVIDIASLTVDDSLQVYPQPSGIQLDKNNDVWVMCSGRNSWHPGGDSKGHLVCIEPDDLSILKDIEFPSVSGHPEELVINSSGDILYYRYSGGIYRAGIGSNAVENLPFIPRENGFYTLAFDNTDHTIFGSDPLDYQQNGWIYKYDANNGAVIDSTESGIIPGEIYIMPAID